MNSIKGHIVDVVHRNIFDGELIIEGEKIVEVRRTRLTDEQQGEEHSTLKKP